MTNTGAFAAVGLLILTSVAVAGDDIAAEVSLCFNPPPAFDDSIEASTDFEIALDENGMPTSIRVTGFTPEDASGRAFAEAAGRAVQRCAPYNGDGILSFTFPPQSESAAPEVIFDTDDQ